MWIQTGVTVRKRLSWVLTSVTLTFDLWPWPFAWTSLWSLVTTPENFMMIRWWEHCQKGVTDGQTDRQTEIAILRAAWSQLKILTHWGWLMHICGGKLTIIGLDNGLSPNQCHAIIWTNAGFLLFEPWGTNFREIWIEIPTFSLKKIHLKVLSAKWRRFCLGLNELGCLPQMQVVSRWGVPVEFWWVSDAGRVDFRISTKMPLFYRISLEKVGTKKSTNLSPPVAPKPWHTMLWFRRLSTRLW